MWRERERERKKKELKKYEFLLSNVCYFISSSGDKVHVNLRHLRNGESGDIDIYIYCYHIHHPRPVTPSVHPIYGRKSNSTMSTMFILVTHPYIYLVTIYLVIAASRKVTIRKAGVGVGGGKRKSFAHLVESDHHDGAGLTAVSSPVPVVGSRPPRPASEHSALHPFPHAPPHPAVAVHVRRSSLHSRLSSLATSRFLSTLCLSLPPVSSSGPGLLSSPSRAKGAAHQGNNGRECLKP